MKYLFEPASATDQCDMAFNKNGDCADCIKPKPMFCLELKSRKIISVKLRLETRIIPIYENIW